MFDFKPAYLGSAGGMVSRPEHNALLLITHAGGARPNIYGDEWDGDELIYTGRGRTGHQKRDGQNRDLGDNQRDNLVFEPTESERLRFIGLATCVEEWTDLDSDDRGEQRSVLRFRLSFQGAAAKAKAPSAKAKKRAAGRKPRPFDPDRIPAPPGPAKANSSPEDSQALMEKAVLGHHQLLVDLRAWLQAQGWAKIEEIPQSIDLWAARPAGGRTIFEAKTVRSGSEGPRVRSAIAQLFEYRFFDGKPDDYLCLVCDRPLSSRRVRLLDGLGIAVLYRADGSFKAGSGSAGALFGNELGA